jgi:hypothetical protein
MLQLSAALVAVMGYACTIGGSVPTQPLIKTCELPTDQTGTLAGMWKTQPVPVAFQAGVWQDDEKAAITAGADTWNTFYNASIGMPKALDYGDASSPRESSAPVPTTLCASGILQGSAFIGQVVIYKQGKWPHPNLPNAMALTSFCPIPGTPLPSMYMAIMEANYQNFFVEGQKVPDLQTIFLHEFGHLMGLGHSCESQPPNANVPNCSESNLNPDYFDAVMFPVFGFDEDGNGQQKRSLEPNDQGRANCLYTGVTAGSGTTGGTN